jgi:hypothetical protein
MAIAFLLVFNYLVYSLNYYLCHYVISAKHMSLSAQQVSSKVKKAGWLVRIRSLLG